MLHILLGFSRFFCVGIIIMTVRDALLCTGLLSVTLDAQMQPLRQLEGACKEMEDKTKRKHFLRNL